MKFKIICRQVIIVIDKAYMFDSSIHEWQECTERANVENDITMLPVRIIVKYDSYGDEQLIWCSRHNKFEIIKEMSPIETVSAEGCRFSGVNVTVVKDPYKIHQGEVMEVSPTRWRIYQKQPLSPIVLIADIANLTFLLGPVTGDKTKCLAKVRIEWKVKSISMDLAKDRFIYYSMLKKESGGYGEVNELIDIPNDIINYLFEILLKEAKLVYGIDPITNETDIGVTKIVNFMAYPLNRNVLEIKKISVNRNESNSVFQKFFPKKQRNIGDSLCRYLGIENAPANLREICSYNIYAAFNYRIYQEFGFKSDEAIKLLWNNHKCLDRDLLSLKYNDHDKESFWWIKTAAFFAWLLNDNDEIKAAEMLQDTYYNIDKSDYKQEILAIYNRGKVPENILEQFKRDGFTGSVYLKMRRAELDRNYRYIKLNYPDFIKEWECSINDYNFRLVRHTLYLRRISEAMNNELEYQWQDMANLSNIIFTIDVRGVYIAYIKIKKAVKYNENDAYEVLDLVGSYGQYYLSLKLVCYYWAAYHHLYDDNNNLQLTRDESYIYNRNIFTLRSLDPNAIVYDNYHLQELLTFPAYTRKTGYYMILTRRLETKFNYKHMSMPFWYSIDEEVAYLKYLLPWITPIWEDAQNEKAEAENLLGWLYTSNKYIPIDKKRGFFWLKRSVEHGYLPAMRNLAMFYIDQGKTQQGKELMIKAAKLGNKLAFCWCISNVNPFDYAILG